MNIRDWSTTGRPPSKESSTKTRIETTPFILSNKSNNIHIKRELQKHKDWHTPLVKVQDGYVNIKSKFHENKDWNADFAGGWDEYNIHQEQVPRKQGLKLVCGPDDVLAGVPSRASSTKTRIETRRTIDSWIPRRRDIKSKFHENKDWNPRSAIQKPNLESPSRASSTKTRIETIRWVDRQEEGIRHQEQVPRKQGLKHSGFNTIPFRQIKLTMAHKTRHPAPRRWFL